MTLFFSLGCFFLVICSCVQAISYDKCGSGKQILELRKLGITPDPIHLSGKNARISLDGTLREDIPAGSRFHIKAWKVKRIFAWDIYIAAPCFLPTGCDVEHCKFLEYFSGGSMCPVTAQSYESDDIEIEIPALGGVVKWFASGRFWIELKITGPKGEQLSCYSIKGEARALFGPMMPEMEQGPEKTDQLEQAIFV